MNEKTKYNLDDWEEWQKPYVIKAEIKNPNYHCNKIYYKMGLIPLNVLFENNYKIHSNWRVYGNCVDCNKQFNSSWKNYQNRKEDRNIIICGNCTRKRHQFSEAWRKKNSEAQLKSQTTPEARQRMSFILKEKHRLDPTLRKKISDGLKNAYKDNSVLRKKTSEASKRNWKKKDYQDKVAARSFHHGYFLSKFGRMWFSSSWELMFILWCEHNSKILHLQRCNDFIPYKKPCGAWANYHPDFEIRLQRESQIVEIKGSRSEKDIVDRKVAAARDFYYGKNKSYTILYKIDLVHMGIFIQSKKVSAWIADLIEKGLIENYGKD